MFTKKFMFRGKTEGFLALISDKQSTHLFLL